VPAHNGGAGVFDHILESWGLQELRKIWAQALGAAVLVIDEAVQRHGHAGDYFGHRVIVANNGFVQVWRGL
jgi:hypothetical protein